MKIINATNIVKLVFWIIVAVGILMIFWAYNSAGLMNQINYKTWDESFIQMLLVGSTLVFVGLIAEILLLFGTHTGEGEIKWIREAIIYAKYDLIMIWLFCVGAVVFVGMITLSLPSDFRAYGMLFALIPFGLICWALSYRVTEKCKECNGLAVQDGSAWICTKCGREYMYC